MKMLRHGSEHTEYGVCTSYPQATRGACGNCCFVLRSDQHE